jgi:hypothetical protein
VLPQGEVREFRDRFSAARTYEGVEYSGSPRVIEEGVDVVSTTRSTRRADRRPHIDGETADITPVCLIAHHVLAPRVEIHRSSRSSVRYRYGSEHGRS